MAYSSEDKFYFSKWIMNTSVNIRHFWMDDQPGIFYRSFIIEIGSNYRIGFSFVITGEVVSVLYFIDVKSDIFGIIMETTGEIRY